MAHDKDYYAILGVLPSIDAVALKAVYQALLKKYHPDVYSGSKDEANRITKDVTEAYSILGDGEKRAAYDLDRMARQSNGGDYEAENADADEDEFFDDEIETAWKTVTKYYPEAVKSWIELNKISKSLSFLYKYTIVKSKSAESHQKISELLKNEYMNRYFGNNLIVQEFVLKAIENNRRDVALETNRAIKILGSPRGRSSTLSFIISSAKNCNWNVNLILNENDRLIVNIIRPNRSQESKPTNIVEEKYSAPLEIISIILFVLTLILFFRYNSMTWPLIEPEGIGSSPSESAATLLSNDTKATSIEKGSAQLKPAFRDEDMSMGDADAKVTIIEYASASCTQCAAFNAEVFPVIKAKYIDRGKVNFVFREFITPPAELAAAGFLTARCAGKDNYFKVVDDVFRSQEEIFRTGDMRSPLLRIAESVGMTEDQFINCVSDEKSLKALAARVEKFSRIDNVVIAPTFVINGIKLDGEPTLAAFEAAIASAENDER